MQNVKTKKRRIDSLISAWSTFLVLLFFFYVLGDIIVGWWHNAWWVWMILGFALIGAITSTFRYIAYSFGRIPDEEPNLTEPIIPAEIPHSNNMVKNQYPINQTSNETKFCKNCGSVIEEPGAFCSNCGEQL